MDSEVRRSRVKTLCLSLLCEANTGAGRISHFSLGMSNSLNKACNQLAGSLTYLVYIFPENVGQQEVEGGGEI